MNRRDFLQSMFGLLAVGLRQGGPGGRARVTQGRLSPVPTGYESMDRDLGGGLPSGGFTLLAGGRWFGAWDLAMNILLHRQDDRDGRVVVCSPSLPRAEVLFRLACIRTDCPRWIATPPGGSLIKAMADKRRAFIEHRDRLAEAVEINGCPLISVREIGHWIHRLQRRHKVDMVCIASLDGLADWHRCALEPQGYPQRAHMEALGRALDDLAASVECPVLAVLELPREHVLRWLDERGGCHLDVILPALGEARWLARRAAAILLAHVPTRGVALPNEIDLYAQRALIVAFRATRFGYVDRATLALRWQSGRITEEFDLLSDP